MRWAVYSTNPYLDEVRKCGLHWCVTNNEVSFYMSDKTDATNLRNILNTVDYLKEESQNE